MKDTRSPGTARRRATGSPTGSATTRCSPRSVTASSPPPRSPHPIGCSTSAAAVAPPPWRPGAGQWPVPPPAWISTDMLEVARLRAAEEGLGTVSFVVGDAQTFAFPADGYDVAISRFGVMFFDDPEAAFLNVACVLAPGRRLAFVCWQDVLANPFIAVPSLALAEHVAAAGPGPAWLGGHVRPGRPRRAFGPCSPPPGLPRWLSSPWPRRSCSAEADRWTTLSSSSVKAAWGAPCWLVPTRQRGTGRLLPSGMRWRRLSQPRECGSGQGRGSSPPAASEPSGTIWPATAQPTASPSRNTRTPSRRARRASRPAAARSTSARCHTAGRSGSPASSP